MAVMRILTLLELLCFFQSTQCFLVQLTLLGFLGMKESIDSSLHSPLVPFDSITLGNLALSLTLFSMFSMTSRRALVLKVVVFSVKSY